MMRLSSPLPWRPLERHQTPTVGPVSATVSLLVGEVI